MSTYRRNRIAGGTYFFTVVAAERRAALCLDGVLRALGEAVRKVRTGQPFHVIAWVLLPDHLHCIWRLPDGDDDFPGRWSAIKRLTTQGVPGLATDVHTTKREGRLWQRRFREHTIRDERDLALHFDYVHWNPVRHGLVRDVGAWPYSTFHRYVRRGWYPESWGGGAGRALDGEVPD